MDMRIRFFSVSIVVLFSLYYGNTHSQSIDDWVIQPLLTNTTEFLWGVHFVDSLNGWCAGFNTILHTTDGGQTWIKQNINNGSHYLRDVFFTDALHGWVVGGYFYYHPYGAVFYTSNGGDDWVLQSESDQWVFYGIYMQDYQKGWIAGGGGNISGICILHTINGGENWVTQYSNSSITEILEDISFCNESTGWAVGSSGTVVKTSDGGNNWTVQNTYTPGYIREVQAISNLTAYACGTTGRFFFTNDGGSNWNYLQLPGEENLNSLYFLNENTGWMVGDLGSLFYTTNGGMNWNGLYFEFDEFLHHVFFSDPEHGWIVGQNELILKTSNGGGLVTTSDRPIILNSEMDVTIWPNPTSGEFELIFSLQRPENINISIYNNKGDMVMNVKKEKLNPGSHSIKTAIPGNQPEGIYMVRLQSEASIYLKDQCSSALIPILFIR